jgi:hypothetical protein
MKSKLTSWNIFIVAFAALMLSLAVLSASSQEKKDTPQVPEAVKVKILQVQLAQEKLQRQFEELNTQLGQVKADYLRRVDELKAAEDEAFASVVFAGSGLNRKEWLLDTTKMEFVPAPKPAAPPAPEPAKVTPAPNGKTDPESKAAAAKKPSKP